MVVIEETDDHSRPNWATMAEIGEMKRNCEEMGIQVGKENAFGCLERV